MEQLRTEAATAIPEEGDDDGGDEAFVGFDAPMFVDLADPDSCCAADPSWFCTSIGCDQNHAQVDPEELERDFRLRVMAARSPNVRKYKSTHRLSTRSIPRCPHSAPAKSRIPKVCSKHSAGGEIVKDRLRNHPVNGLRATPATKIKTVASVAQKEVVKVTASQMESRTPALKSASRVKAIAVAKTGEVRVKPELSQCRTPASEAGSKVRRREVASRYLLPSTKNLKSCVDLGANGSARKLDVVKSTAKDDSQHPKKCKADHADAACGDENPQVEMPEQGTVGVSHKPLLALQTTFDAAEISVKKASMQEEQEAGNNLKSCMDLGSNGSARKLEAGKSTVKNGSKHRKKWKADHVDVVCGDEHSQVEMPEEGTVGGSYKPLLALEVALDAAETSVKKASVQQEQEAEKSTQQKTTRNRRKWNVEHADAPCRDENSHAEELEQSTPGSSHKPMLTSSKLGAEIPVNGTGAAVFEPRNDGADDDNKENAQQFVVLKPVKKASCGKVEQKQSKIKRTTSPKPFRLRTDERGILKDANSGERQLVSGQHKIHADVLMEKFQDSKGKKLNNTSRSTSTDQATSRPEKRKRALGFLPMAKSTNPNSTIVPRVQGVKPFRHQSKALKTAESSLMLPTRPLRTSCCNTQKLLAEKPGLKVR